MCCKTHRIITLQDRGNASDIKTFSFYCFRAKKIYANYCQQIILPPVSNTTKNPKQTEERSFGSP